MQSLENKLDESEQSDELDYYYLLYKLVNSDSYWVVIKTKNIKGLSKCP